MDTHFIQTPTPEPLIERLVTEINNALSADIPVAWFLSGGSAITIASAVAEQIIEGEPRQRLRILQIDERFGPVGHADSKMTLNVYAQMQQRAKRDNGAKLTSSFAARASRPAPTSRPPQEGGLGPAIGPKGPKGPPESVSDGLT